MVVQFAIEAVPASSSDDRHPVKKKYLVSRSREKKNSIFDYVHVKLFSLNTPSLLAYRSGRSTRHLSSNVLRKVRYGQSLDAAMQARNTRMTGSSSPGFTPLDKIDFRLSKAFAIHRSLKLNGDHPQTMKSSNQRIEKLHTRDGCIRFGRQIQLQATDGCFLALEEDGSLCKLPKRFQGDPRTLLTLFPQDPLHAPGSKSAVSVGELCFLVQGSATIATHHQVLYVDSKAIPEPPGVFREAVIQFQREHGDETKRRPTYIPHSSTIWSFQTASVHGEAHLESGMLVQLIQGEQAVHYEIEKIVKRKYTPITSSDPESAESDEVEVQLNASQISSSPESASSPIGVSDQDHARQSSKLNLTHVWLQSNTRSSQLITPDSIKSLTSETPESARRNRWDNLWFIHDVAVEQRREHERKQLLAALDTEDEVDEDTELNVDPEEPFPCEQDTETINQPETSDGDDDAYHIRRKRISILNAKLFVSRSAEDLQNHAAAIIVRFLRRVSRREAERRAKDLIERRIRRTGKKSRRQGEVSIQLSTGQQLQVLQCYNPSVYGSLAVREPKVSPSRRVPGVSLQNSKYPDLEMNRLATMERSLRHLGSSEFQQQQVTMSLHSSSGRPPLGHRSLSSLKLRQEHVAKERQRDRDLHVQLAMAHHEKPPFRFGKHNLVLPSRHYRPQTAPASPKSKR